jgi:exosortase family protein XrtF
MNWREFKPTFYFLTKFLGLYLTVNVVYGLYVTSYEPNPDPITQWVTRQTSTTLTLMGWTTYSWNNPENPTTAIVHNSKAIVAVYEGCNGVNIMLIFIAFLIAFGPVNKRMLWFAMLGILVIHVSNIARIALLFIVSLELPTYLYFSHKYLFTAFIYAIIFVLWMVWVKYFSYTPNHEK